MPTNQSTSSGKTRARSTTARKTKNDAITLLTEDHNKVKKDVQGVQKARGKE
jgi:hypothetical protein